MNTVKLDQNGNLAILTLNREEVMNVINQQMLLELETAVKTVEANPEVRCLIITGAGTRAFAAGADIEEMYRMDEKQAYRFAMDACCIIDRISSLRVPTIAAINGYALGGGLELALACDLRIASMQAILGLPEVSLGIISGWGGTRRLPKLIGYAYAAQLVFDGSRVMAQDACRMGLVNECVEAENLMATAIEKGNRICRCAPLAVAAAKQSMQHYFELNQSSDFENTLFSKLFETQDQKNAMSRFLQKEKDTDFKGR